jgi:Cof subfamily protein (haloacid dehalogenase superfamily)
LSILNTIRRIARSNPGTRPGSAPNPPAAGAFRLLAVDIDGTLLDSAGRVRPATIAAINAARARQVNIVLASARPPRGMRELYHALGLDTPMICYNGAVIHQPLTGRWITHHALAPGLVRQLVETARTRSPRLTIGAEILDRYCVHVHDPAATPRPATTQTIDDPADSDPADIDPVTVLREQQLYERPVTRLLLGVASAQRSAVAQLLARRFGGRVAVGITDRAAIQLVHPLADKAHALAAMARDMGIEPAHVMAVGDAPNDLGMLNWAGLGVAIGEAFPQVNRAADVTAPSSDADGLAWAIERFILRDPA